MVTDTRTLLIEGVKLAQKTFVAARVALGWVVEEMDEFVIHQVSKVHTAAFVKAMGIDPKKVLTIFGERSEEHTSELQTLMRISYAVFCLKKNMKQINYTIK